MEICLIYLFTMMLYRYCVNYVKYSIPKFTYFSVLLI